MPVRWWHWLYSTGALYVLQAHLLYSFIFLRQRFLQQSRNTQYKPRWAETTRILRWNGFAWNILSSDKQHDWNPDSYIRSHSSNSLCHQDFLYFDSVWHANWVYFKLKGVKVGKLSLIKWYKWSEMVIGVCWRATSGHFHIFFCPGNQGA